MRAVVTPYEKTALEEVLGPSGERHQVLFLRDRPAAETSALGVSELARLYWRPQERIRVEDVLAHLPMPFQPDAVVYWSIEYHPVPVGIEDASIFTAAVVGDWNLGGQAVQTCGGAFDLLIADRAGCGRLKHLGFPRVRYAPLWGFDPRLHRRLPHVHRDLEIVMAGNFNHDIQRERAPWLARIARLSHRYRVCVTTGVVGEEYTKLLCRARIVFNRSIRGEINMRAYEAAACGALLFYERENPEIGQLFMDGEECILYGPDDLEDLLDRYLTDEPARARIAEAGWRRVQTHTNRHHLGLLLDIVADEMRASGCRKARLWSARSATDRALARAHQWLSLGDVFTVAAADGDLQGASHGAPVAAVGRAVLLARVAESMGASAERLRLLNEAASVLRSVIAGRPQCVGARWNLAQVLLALGESESAERELGEVTRWLGHGNPAAVVESADLAVPIIPRRYDAFDVELEAAWATHPEGSGAWIHAMAKVLCWRSWEILSDLAFQRGDFAEAEKWARMAVDAKPHLAGAHFRLARALRALGRSMDAIAAYRSAIAAGPLYSQIWLELAQLLADLGSVEEFEELAAQAERIAQGCPPWTGVPEQINRMAPRRRLPATQRRDCLRVVACPDWSTDENWQTFVARLVSACRQPQVTCWGSGQRTAGAVELILRVEASSSAQMDELATRLAHHLEVNLGLPPDDPLQITLDCGPLQPEDRWQLLHGVHFFVVSGEGGKHDETYRSLAKAMGVPIIPVDLLGSVSSAELAAA